MTRLTVLAWFVIFALILVFLLQVLGLAPWDWRYG